MKRERYSKEFVKNYVSNFRDELGRNPKITELKEKNSSLYWDIVYYYQNLNTLYEELGFPSSGTYRGHTFSKQELIKYFQNFVLENGFIPSGLYWDKHSKELNLPNRKTYNNKFGNWCNVIHECGYDDYLNDHNYILTEYGNYKLKHDDPEFLIHIIFAYIEANEKIPTCKEISKYYGTSLTKSYMKYFGGWNECLKSLNLSYHTLQYTDEELDKYFMDFVNEYHRTPSIREFNKTGRPSFWCYQQRFGSWAKACIHYGCKPNYRKPHYYMDDGERCDSRYEYDISTWLKVNNIKYDRDIPYKDFTNNYNGKMNCDYRFVLDNGEIWYVEMAGFIDTNDFHKLTSREEELYYFKLKYKKKLFEENKLNYIIIHPSDLKNHTMDEIFYFLNINKCTA